MEAAREGGEGRMAEKGGRRAGGMVQGGGQKDRVIIFKKQ